MIIRYAEIADYLWLRKFDIHISEDVLKLKIEREEIYVAQDDNELVGWLRYNLFWDSIPFMNMLYFLEEYRGKGLGKKIVYHWENEMKKKGFKKVLTSTLSNEEAQHFYRKMGYKEIGGFILDEPLEILFHKEL